MWGTDNSIEPVRATAAVAASSSTATRKPVEEPPIREATPGDLASAARRSRASAAPEPAPVHAVREARGSLFRRRSAEPDKPDAVAQQHGLYTAVKGSTHRYYADYQQKQEVMRADPKRISTKLDDKQTVSAMLDLAQSRGWDTVRVKGTADFQREAWVQAQVRGMKAEGYRPTATDEQEAARRKAAVAPIQASPVQAPATTPKAIESTAPAGAAAPKDTAKVTNSLTASAQIEKAEAAHAKAVVAPQPRRAAAARRTAAAAPAPVAGEAAAPATSDKAKMVPIQRSKAVWGAVEATGQQARAADPAVAKATAGERPTAASVT